MLEVWFIPQLRDTGVVEDVWLQHDWASTCTLRPHCVTFWMNILRATVLAVLHQHLPRHNPGHNVVLILSHRQLFVVHNQGQVAAHRHRNNGEMRKAVERAFTTIKPQMLQRTSHNMAAHHALFRTRRCTYRSTWCTVTLTTQYVKTRFGTVPSLPPCTMKRHR